MAATQRAGGGSEARSGIGPRVIAAVRAALDLIQGPELRYNNRGNAGIFGSEC
jgi:hypothetical protein